MHIHAHVSGSALMLLYVIYFHVVPLEMLYNYCQLLKFKGLCADSYANWLKGRSLQFSNQEECCTLLKRAREGTTAEYVECLINVQLLDHSIF